MTLLEALVTVAILALVSAIAFPAMERSAQGLAIAQARVQLASDLRVAHGRAILQDRAVRLVVPPGAAGHHLDDVPQLLPQGMQVSLDGGAAMTFYPDGTASGGRVLLRRRGGSEAIHVDPVTSAVRTDRVRPDE